MVEEAIANGTWIPPTSGRGAKVDMSKKPSMHNAYLGGGGYVTEKEAMEWYGITPFAASYAEPPPPPVQSASFDPPTPPPATFMTRLLRRNQQPPLLASAPVPMTPIAPILSPAPSTLNVSVLIAMPSQTAFHEKGSEVQEEDLPHVEVGVAKVRVPADNRDEITVKSSSSSSHEDV